MSNRICFWKQNCGHIIFSISVTWQNDLIRCDVTNSQEEEVLCCYCATCGVGWILGMKQVPCFVCLFDTLTYSSLLKTCITYKYNLICSIYKVYIVLMGGTEWTDDVDKALTCKYVCFQSAGLMINRLWIKHEENTSNKLTLTNLMFKIEIGFDSYDVPLSSKSFWAITVCSNWCFKRCRRR